MTESLRSHIDEALLSTKWTPSIPAALRAIYDAEQQADRRVYNTWVLVAFVIIFDCCLIPQFRSAPELVPLSALLRFCVLTPAYAAFLWFDHRRRLDRWYEPLILALAVMPIVISAILCLRTTSTTTMADIRATRLILLSTGLVWRMPARTQIANALISSVILIASVIAAGPPVVPVAELYSLIAIDLIVASNVIGFAMQIERRDRRVFLLTTNERLRREALAALNRGLLLENQTDALTGVANRRCFDETLAATWMDCLNSGRAISLIMLDVDHFKKFNDHYGHQGGDECLRRVAAGGRSRLRAGDLFARYGGEEFAVILPDASADVAARLAEQIRLGVRALEMPHHGAGPEACVTISLGVACMVPTDANGAKRLMEEADRALYAAKAAGRDTVEQAVLP